MIGLVCGERACPALGGEAAPMTSLYSARYTAVTGFGAAAAAQRGTSPLATGNLPHPRTYCGPLALCGERACPALGGEAAPMTSPCSARYTPVTGFGAAAAAQRGTSPLATGNLPHPRTYCGPLALCGERACPALGGGAALTASLYSARYTAVAGFGAATAAQRGRYGVPASPLATGNLPHPRTYCGPLALCGERACPALGGEAAPMTSPCSARYTAVTGFGAATAAQRGRYGVPASPLATRGSKQPQ